MGRRVSLKRLPPCLKSSKAATLPPAEVQAGLEQNKKGGHSDVAPVTRLTGLISWQVVWSA